MQPLPFFQIAWDQHIPVFYTISRCSFMLSSLILLFIRQETANLGLPKSFVDTAFGKQFLVRPIFLDLALLKNQDAIHMQKRRQAMCNDNGGFALHQLVK